MAKFHLLKVADIRQETKEATSIAFEIPVELKEEYKYIQGQYLTLKLTINGEDVRRSYSICSSPFDNEIRIAVKKVTGGRASTFINEAIKPGMEIPVLPPVGNFHTSLDANNEGHYIGFAAGSGITPLMSIIKTTLHIEQKSTFTLFYGNKDSESIIFKDELQKLKTKYGERLNIYNVLSREDTGNELTNGRIDGERAEKLIAQNCKQYPDIHYFICGPEAMMTSVSKMLESKSIDKNYIHFELFTTPAPDEDKSDNNDEDTELSSKPSKVTIILDGEEKVIELAGNGPVIVDAAIAAGLDAPFSCHGAVCCTCRAKITSGKVKMDMNYALTDEEVADGFVLTCQSHPLTDEVTVNYDEIF